MNVIDMLELVDIWRLKYPDLVRYSWRRLNQASRLDYFLMSFSLAPKVKKVLIGDRMQSDHHTIDIIYIYYSYIIYTYARLLEI